MSLEVEEPHLLLQLFYHALLHVECFGNGEHPNFLASCWALPRTELDSNVEDFNAFNTSSNMIAACTKFMGTFYVGENLKYFKWQCICTPSRKAA
jgi:hypothetical protein